MFFHEQYCSGKLHHEEPLLIIQRMALKTILLFLGGVSIIDIIEYARKTIKIYK